MEKQDTTKWIGIILTGFLVALVGSIIIAQTAGEVIKVTERTSVSAEAHAMNVAAHPNINDTTEYTLTNAPAGWKAGGECPIANFVLTNGTDALTITTDYTVDLDTGIFKLVENANMNASGSYNFLQTVNSTYASYGYCGDSYQSGWGGTVLNMVPGFFALGILMGVAFLIIWILRKEGIGF
jgi:hypothetical protein